MSDVQPGDDVVRVWRDGEAVEPAAVSPVDRGVTLGFGVFETVRLYGGVPFRLDRHLERLAGSARRLGIPVPEGTEERTRQVVAKAGLESARLRVTLTGGVADEPGSGQTLIVRVHEWHPQARWYEEGIRGVGVSVPRGQEGLTGGAKSTSRAESVVATREVREAGADEGLWRDREGRWVEGTASNLFAVLDGCLVTPPLSSGCLAGVTREVVLELAHGLELSPREETLEPDTFDRASEAFITSSLREAVPLVSVNDRAVGQGRPGAVSRRVAGAYRERAADECGL